MVKAAARGIIDYTTYDRTSEWVRRERMLLYDLAQQELDKTCSVRREKLITLLTSDKLSTDKAIEAYDALTELTEKQVQIAMPWREEKLAAKTAKAIEVGKPLESKRVSSANSAGANKLVDWYNEVLERRKSL